MLLTEEGKELNIVYTRMRWQACLEKRQFVKRSARQSMNWQTLKNEIFCAHLSPRVLSLPTLQKLAGEVGLCFRRQFNLGDLDGILQGILGHE